jgi:hypothetical protein
VNIVLRLKGQIGMFSQLHFLQDIEPSIIDEDLIEQLGGKNDAKYLELPSILTD